MGAAPAMVLTLLAWPRPANRRCPDASCTSTHESAEKLNRNRACPAPGTGSAPPAGAESTAGSDAEPATRSAGRPSAAPPAEEPALGWTPVPGTPWTEPSSARPRSPPAAVVAPVPSAVDAALDAVRAIAAAGRDCQGRHHRT